MRNAALACVMVGGLLMSGPAMVALADETGGEGDDGGAGGTGTAVEGSDTQSTAGAATAAPHTPPKWPGLHWFPGLPQPNTARVGPISPPKMNVPSWLAPSATTTTKGGVEAFMLPSPTTTRTNPQWVAVVPDQQQGQQQQPAAANPVPSDNTPGVDFGTGQSQPLAPAGSEPPRKPTLSIPGLQLVPPNTPVDSGIRVKNPLPNVEDLGLDPTKPLLTQILPPPLAMLIVMAEHIPLVNLVVTPLVGTTDAMISALLSDVVITVGPAGTVPTPGTIPMSTSFTSSRASMFMPPVGGPPPEIAPMGIDVPLAPAPEPLQPAPPTPPAPPQPTNNSVDAVSNQVEFRAGYSEYLRNAGMAQITAIAVPGAVAILLFTVGGGFIGYRQARAGHVIRAEGIGRFLR